MSKPSNIEARVAALGTKVDANRTVINALGVQTAARFDRLENEMHTGFARVDARMDRLENEMHTGFAEMRGKLDQAAAGQEQIVGLLTGLIEGGSERSP